MDDNNSKNKSNRCWGVTDLEEDEETYNVYQISKEKVNEANSVTIGFNKSPAELSVPIVEKKKRSKPKGKSNATTPIDETKRQLASFTFSHNPVEENSELNINKLSEEMTSLPYYKHVEELINRTTEIKENKAINVPIYQGFPSNQLPQQTRPILSNLPMNDYNTAMMYQANLIRMTTPQMSYSNYCAPVRYLQQQNPYLPLGNLAMKNQAPRIVNYKQINSTKTTYYERLDVIDVLFRFIIQILRSPEQPPFEQIEEIKNLLDSLVVKTNETHLT